MFIYKASINIIEKIITENNIDLIEKKEKLRLVIKACLIPQS